MEDIARTLLFVLDDKNWFKKVVVGAAFTFLSCLVVGIPFCLGYLLELQRRVVRGTDPPLPEWDDLPKKFVDGLRFLGIALVYYVCLGIATAILSHVPFVGAILAVLLWVAVTMGLFYVMVRFAMTDDMGGAFNVRAVYEVLRNNFVNFLLVLFLAIVYKAVACLGLAACVVGVFFTLFWAGLAISYAACQAYMSSGQAEDADAA